MDKIICYCKNVSAGEIKQAINQGAKTLKQVQDATSACTGNSCRELNPKGVCCADDILKLLPRSENSCSCCS